MGGGKAEGGQGFLMNPERMIQAMQKEQEIIKRKKRQELSSVFPVHTGGFSTLAWGAMG